MLAKTLPLPSAAGNSGLPGRSVVKLTVLFAVSMTVTFLLRPLKAQTVLVDGSKTIPSGLVPAEMLATLASVWRSKTMTALAPPSEM
jgi:hypothetical protein